MALKQVATAGRCSASGTDRTGAVGGQGAVLSIAESKLHSNDAFVVSRAEGLIQNGAYKMAR